jgi:ABC-2 type transport system permease protein
MLHLYLKEIKSFLGSLIGYVVIGVFLLLTGLFVWIFPGEFNILDSGFASLEPLFFIAPWVFIFLIPAITMRMLSEELRTGTIEMLLTKPLTEMQIILAKYMAGVTLVVIALLPTLVYYFTVHHLGLPQGNLDKGATMGSFFGLVLLGGAFTAIGLLASGISQNQVVAFLLAALLCFFIYVGFESLATISAFRSIDDFLMSMGMYDHYKSMGRGLIDTRDLAYFFGLIFIFLNAARLILRSRRW